MTRRRALAVSLLCSLLGLPALAGTFSLQQGVSGYGGCTDTYIANDGYSQFDEINYGSDTNLLLNSEHFNGG